MKYTSFVMMALSLFLTSCQPKPINESVDSQTFNSLMNSGQEIVVLDVRTPEEYAGGFIGKAVNVDYDGPTFNEEISKLDKTKTYLVYCEAGGRSKSAAALMKQEGFTNVYELEGGIAEWINNNMPLSKKED